MPHFNLQSIFSFFLFFKVSLQFKLQPDQSEYVARANYDCITVKFGAGAVTVVRHVCFQLTEKSRRSFPSARPLLRLREQTGRPTGFGMEMRGGGRKVVRDIGPRHHGVFDCFISPVTCLVTRNSRNRTRWRLVIQKQKHTFGNKVKTTNRSD